MANGFDTITSNRQWRCLVEAAKRAAMEAGFHLLRVPGRGLSNIWIVTKGDSKPAKASIRTSRDRHIAFPPLNNGTRWKTLSDVELVFLAAVDDKDAPRNVEVYAFPAAEVRKRFDAAYAARTKDGQKHRDNFGMWVPIDPDPRGIASSVGSGLATAFRPIAVYSIASLLAAEAKNEFPAESEADTDAIAADEPQAGRPSIGDVLAAARKQIAEIAGMPAERIKLDLKFES